MAAQVMRLLTYQEADAAWLLIAENGLLANPMGLGKSVSVLASLEVGSSIGLDTLPAVVICPNSVKRHWANEITRFEIDMRPYVLEGGAATRNKMIGEALGDPRALVIVNFEAVRLHSRLAPYGSIRLARCIGCGGTDEKITPARCEVHPKGLNEFPARTIIIDEAHRIKDPQAKQTRACWSVAHGSTVTRRIALTGTPIANHVGDLWSIMHAVAPHEYPSRTRFIDRYALQSWNPFGSMDIVGIRPDTRDELFRFLDPRMRRVRKEDVLPQLPPKVYSTRLAPMGTKQAKAYKELEQTLVAELDGELLIAPTNLTGALRLLQLASSYGELLESEELDGPLRYRLKEPSPKLDVLEEILDDMEGRPIVVCALSRQLIELAAKRLEARHESFGLITGAVHEAQRQRTLDEFQAKRLRVLLFTIQAGGTGLTMTAADTIVFLQRSWSMLENMQATDRVHRIGSEVHERVHVIDVIAPGTIEEKQLARLHEKRLRLEEVLRDGGRLEDMNVNDDLREAS
jgi:SNF2 family DNA or RNA helicase